MCSPITWTLYFKTAGILIAVYYALVLTLFFRSDIKKFFTKKRQKKKPHTNIDSSAGMRQS